MDVPPLIQEGTIEKENILEVTDCIENLNEVEWYFLIFKNGCFFKSIFKNNQHQSPSLPKNFRTSLTTFTMGRLTCSRRVWTNSFQLLKDSGSCGTASEWRIKLWPTGEKWGQVQQQSRICIWPRFTGEWQCHEWRIWN